MVIEVKMPGRFDAYFSGTGIGQGQLEEDEPGERAAYAAYQNSESRRAGKGYYLVIAIDDAYPPVAIAALDVFLDHAVSCASLVAHERDEPAEGAAALTFVKRLLPAYEQLGAEFTGWRRKQFNDAGVVVPRSAPTGSVGGGV